MSAGATRVVGGDVLLPSGIERTDVTISDGRIRGIGATVDIGSDDIVVDVSGMLVAPGLIDLQCNGAGGVDFTNDAAAIGTLSSVLPRFGVTSFLPSVVTSDAESRKEAIDAVNGFRATRPWLDLLGCTSRVPRSRRTTWERTTPRSSCRRAC